MNQTSHTPRHTDPLEEFLARNQAVLMKLSALTVLVLAGLFLAFVPIRFLDTDLFYHLSGGRFFWDTGKLANPMDISFIEQKTTFINYFWGFQAIAYQVFDSGGFVALILIKTSVLLIAAWFSLKIILRDAKLSEAKVLQLVVAGLAIYLLSMRGVTVRPHVFSYAFIPIFIYIFQHRQNWLPALPLLTLCWINIHGVEWVVGALIGGAFGVQKLFEFSRHRDTKQLKPLLWVMACIPVMLINPNGVNVLLTPFINSPDIYYFIDELKPLDLNLWMDFRVGLSADNILLVLAIFYIVCLGLVSRQFTANIFTILLAVGAGILLYQGTRFVWEWLLLSLPLFAFGCARLGPAAEKLSYPTALLLLLLPTILGYSWWQETRKYGGDYYPTDERLLPVASTDFIEATGLAGKYAVPPDLAGYIEWRLGQKGVQIFSDMQYPPFDEANYFEIRNAITHPAAHQRFIKKYAPDMIGVPPDNRYFQAIVDQRYVPVFFDQTLVLYVNAATRPDIANKYKLTIINPFNVLRIRARDVEGAIAELQTLLSLSPDNEAVRSPLALMLMELGREAAANQLLKPTSMAPNQLEEYGFYLGKIAMENENYQLAIDHFTHSIRASSDPMPAQRLMATCYYALEDYQQAYNLFEASMNPYRDMDITLMQLYQFADSAFQLGDKARARRLLAMIAMRNDSSDPALTKLSSSLADQLQ